MTARGGRLPTHWPSTSLAALWRAQLSASEPDLYSPPAGHPRGWMLAAGLAGVLEPFAQLAERPGDLTWVSGLDGAAAAVLLDQLPVAELAQRHNDSPTARTMLEQIAAHPELTAQGLVVGPDRTDEGLSLNGLVVDAPDLLALPPDIVAGPLPELLASLGPDARANYLAHRDGCVEGSVRRQQWYAIRHRYGLQDALQAPAEITEVGWPDGRQLLLRWS